MAPEKKKVPILIVDDSPDNLLVLRAVLKRDDYNIVEASSGPEALERFREQEFAVILLDIQMPVMDGYQVAEHIRQMNKSRVTPIIFVTAGMNEDHLIHHGYEAGAVDYLFKPVDPAIIRSKVNIFAELYLAKLEIEKQGKLLREIDEGNRNSFLENALDAVIGMNDSGEINYWNIQAEKIFGWRKEEVMGTSLAKLGLGLEKFFSTEDGSKLNKRIEVSARRKDRSEFPIEISVTSIWSNDKLSFSAFIRDISQRKLEQMNLQKAIQARDEFISICSHELKTPLTSMQLQFQMAEKLYSKNDPKVFEREHVKKRILATNKQLKRMGKLIEDMLDVSRMSSTELVLEKEEINLLQLINDVIDTFQDQLNASHIRVNIENHTYSDTRIFGDAFRLEQVISNLLSNAIKYGLGKPIDVRLQTENKKVLIKVIDHGMGILEKDIRRIFERYERAIKASEVSGLGLGLYIGQQIIKAHGGDLKVHSRPDKGSTFIIELPIIEKGMELSH